ncbi:RTT106 [Candida pseudojiufengensis]|uniref:RTT106 n=1 Tax=Candida pseudojiufengensis TaxID=497109 RepID=UPI0022243CA5|nr:RTT106 [Candida pseudojiufengensis]KAI5962983.1 RTT106 [Candida pseudojiufengensis]
MDWLQELPPNLRSQITNIINKDPSTHSTFNELYEYFETSKRRKLGNGNDDGDNEVEGEGGHEELTPSSSVHPSSIIFEIQQISFMSPLRKKMNLTFHLIEQDNQAIPVLSIVNPATNAPELSFINLSQAVKLCLVLPVLGNSTNPSKKGVCYLCFWIHDSYYADTNISKDPIICLMYLDQIKKQMIKSGKLQSNIDTQFGDMSNYKNDTTLNPVQERILDYFKRQFKLCGINLINYLPCDAIFKNKFLVNKDNAVALTSGANTTNPSIIIVECHKGARDGNLIFLEKNEFNNAFMIFAFKKPILVFSMSKVLRASYTNITKHSFSLNVVVLNDRNEERPIEYSMIDVANYQLIDDFIKRHGIADDSYNEENKEKQISSTSNATHNNEASNNPVEVTVVEDIDDEDDEDEDADFQGGNEEEDGSDVAEEYDSEAEPSGGDDNVEGQEDDIFVQSKEE